MAARLDVITRNSRGEALPATGTKRRRALPVDTVILHALAVVVTIDMAWSLFHSDEGLSRLQILVHHYLWIQ